MLHDLDALSKAVGEQVTATSGQVFVVPRSANEQEANAKKIEVDTDIARENLWKIKWHRRIIEGGIPGFFIGILLCTLVFLIFYKR